MQITSAMKMVSASKLKRAQQAIEKMRPCSEKLSAIIQNVSANSGGSEGQYARASENKKVLIVAITSNRGLCGAFNANVVKKVNQIIREQYLKADVTVYSVGKKGADFFKDEFFGERKLLPENPSGIFDDLTFENSAKISSVFMKTFVDGTFDKVILVYNSFKNAAVQILKEEQFLPIEQNAEETEASNINYIFEPKETEILEDLIPQSLQVQFFKSLLDSSAAEHGARMTAMHKATDNAEEIIGDLKLTYNKMRQASITNEILEIVSGAEALKG
jgi:F-type H+-transporting ATPase subunit gamma